MRRRSLTWLGAVAVAAILAATALATIAATRDGGDHARDTRSALVAPAIRALAAELAQATATVESLRAFFESSDEVTAEDFARFTAGPLLRQPSLDHLAWDPSDPGAAPLVRGEEPRGARGGAARERARDDGAARLGAPVPGPGAGSVVVVVDAVYSPGAAIATVAERRAALRGFVSTQIPVAELGAAAAAGLPPGARVVVRDGATPVIGAAADAGAGTQGVLEVAGRRWAVAIAGVDGDSPLLPVAVAVAGALLAGVVALLFIESAGREREVRGELARLRVRHDLILASAGDGIIGVDADGRADFVNPAAARMLGSRVEELTGERLTDPLLAPIAALVDGGGARTGEEVLRRRDGSTFSGEYTTTPIGEGGGAVLTFRDVTARKRIEAQTLENLAAAEELAAVNPLTGLPNRRTFHERLTVEVERARRHRRGVALVLMDLDHFKRVNDLHGHQAGDRVLEHAARILDHETRTGELVARVGGEEFAMILPEADEDEAFRAAERIRRAIAASPFPAVGAMTMSAGVCDLSRAPDAEALYRLADDALYRAKHGGRDMVLRYSPEPGGTPSAREAGERLERQQTKAGVRLLARLVDAKAPFAAGHAQRVGDLCAELADELGWPPERAALLREAGLVHDVGMIGVPDGLLLTAGPLAAAQIEVVRAHPTLGAGIVDAAFTEEQASWVACHHERWDGTGYPGGLRAEECPEGARIVALAEAWDAMTSERPHVTVPLSSADAIAECRAHAGGQFWAPAVEALVAVVGRR